MAQIAEVAGGFPPALPSSRIYGTDLGYRSRFAHRGVGIDDMPT